MKVQRLLVGKGKTMRPGDAEEWVKEYYEIEVLIEDPAELEVTKANLTGLIDGWLSHSKPGRAPAQSREPTWDSAKIKWVEAQGSSGPYERAEDVNSQDFKVMVKGLAAHKGRFSKDGFFYWLFTNGSTVGRKKTKTSLG